MHSTTETDLGGWVLLSVFSSGFTSAVGAVTGGSAAEKQENMSVIKHLDYSETDVCLQEYSGVFSPGAAAA